MKTLAQNNQTKAQEQAAYAIDAKLEELVAEYGIDVLLSAIVKVVYESDLSDSLLERLGNEIGRIPSMRLRKT